MVAFPMIKNRNNRNKKIELNYILTAVILIIFSLVITFTGFLLQPNDFSEILSNIIKHPIILLLNGFPVFLAILFFYFLFNNIFYASALVSIIFNVASLINRNKIILRDDPFVPLDVFLGAEAAKIMSDTKLKVDFLLVAIVVLFSLLILACGIFIKFKKVKLGIKITGCIVIIAIAILANNYVYSSRALYDRMPTKSKAYVTGVFNDLGFNYCFLYNLSAYKMEVPENYSKQAAQKLIEKYSNDSVEASSSKSAVKPNVIMIMNEAFSDISLDKAFNFSSEDDPLKNYKQISSQKNAVSAHMIVPNFGGGTANTEFDVLTGMQTLNLNTVPTSAFRLVRRNISSIARVFSDNSYQNLFIHPGDDWFYNRTNVYRFMGIDNQIFVDSFKKPQDLKGSLISDKAAGKMIIDQFEQNVKNNKGPLFNYNVTIQNHMPYTKNKYSAYKLKDVATSKNLSDESKILLSNYFEGVRDADSLLKTLTDYFSNREEPVILVFFGDHKPSLGDNYLAYKELGIDINENGTIEQAINSKKVPLLIWSNESAYNSLMFDSAVTKLDLPEDKTISANYLGSLLLELVGLSGKDPYFDFLNEARRELPITTRYYYKTRDGQYTDKLTEKQSEIVGNIKIWQYYRMNTQKVN
jgi:phosphoglycerol transferase MdoB-like AlkP superfamily enzyme